MEKVSKKVKRQPIYDFSKDEFLDFLREYTIWRKNFDESSKSKQVSELSKEEEDIIYSLYRTKTLEEACEILKPLYQKYINDSEDDEEDKGKDKDIPDLILRSIYFIIMRECVWNVGEEKKIQSEDGLVRKRIKVGRTGDVFKALGEKSSKRQERLGIRPYWDFQMLSFLPVNFNSLSYRGRITREVILSILLHYEYPCLIDLSGEITIFEDIYYGKCEILNCTDSVVAIFYQALKLKYGDFKKHFIKSLSALPESVDEETVIKTQYEEMLAKNKKEHTKKARAICTYPDSVEDINLEVAFGYLLVKLLKDGNSISELKEMYSQKLPDEVIWLRDRINATVVSWDKVEDILNKLRNCKVENSVLSKDGTTEEDIVEMHFSIIDEYVDYRFKTEKEPKLREKPNMSDEAIEAERKRYHINSDKKRLKKGVLFYDYTVQRDTSSIVAFKDFIARDTCYWIFVCDKSDSGWASEIKKYGRISIEINPDYQFMLWYDAASFEKVVITNIRINNLLYDNIFDNIKNLMKNSAGIDEENFQDKFFEIERLSK